WLCAPGFPSGERGKDGKRRWQADQVWQWLAAQDPDLAAGVHLKHWPRGKARYEGARAITDGVVQDWSVQGVVLRVLWPTVRALSTARVAAAAATLSPGVPRVINVRQDFGRRGPSLGVYDETGHMLEVDDPAWPHLALVLGGRAPYWPYG